MSVTSSLTRAVGDAARDVLLGISAYTRAKSVLSTVTLDSIDERRDDIGGGLLTPPAVTPTRWYLSDLEAAQWLADTGDLRRAGQLMLAARKDGHLAGVLSTRTGGLVRLPRVFRGDDDLVSELERGHDSIRSAFDEMMPPAELALLAADGLLLGIGVAELVPVRGRQYPVMVRLDPQYLKFLWTENRWFYASSFGLLPITPGDGRWVLHTPGGRIAPWQSALWLAVGQAWIRKQHASLYRDNWEAKLAHPARVAVAPPGASEDQKLGLFQQLMAWGINTVFALPVGYDAKLLESNGIGWQSFNTTISQCNEEFVLAIAGQTVTTTGGTGFANADIHKSIRADLIKETADGLAHTVNTQCLPPYVAFTRGAEAVLSMSVQVEWDVTPPKDRNAEASAMVTVATAVTQLTEALAPSDLEPNVRQLVDRFGIPVQPKPVDPEAALTGDGGAGADAQDTALNGAQIASLLEVIEAVAQGQIPRDAAVAIIQRAFNADAETADKLLGSVGAGFVPKSLDAGPAAPPALPAPPDTTTTNTTEVPL